MIKAALMWDIDGTLLSTGRAGIYAWEDSTEIVLGVPCDFSALRTAGLTDLEIAGVILDQTGFERSNELVAELVSHYERLLPQSLPRKQGRVLPNVVEILESINEREDILSILVTGNTSLGAKAKLEYYGLAHYFTQGSYSGERHLRVDVVRHGLELVRAVSQHLSLDRMFVIGDTPHDVSCANSIGVKTLAVGTGEYSYDELVSLTPWQTVKTLPIVSEFNTLLDIEV